MSEPIKKQNSFLNRIKTATSAITNVEIDYNHPDYDEDWVRSRQKLQPLLAHEIHRPLKLNQMDRLRALLLKTASGLLTSGQNSRRLSRSLSRSRSRDVNTSGLNAGEDDDIQSIRSDDELMRSIRRRQSNTSHSLETFYSGGITIENKDDFDETNPGQQLVALNHIINVPISTLTTLTIKPGEPHFLLWYSISSYFPLLTACLGPVANMISFIGLIQHWRVDKNTGEEKNDDGYLLALNITLLILGLIGNASLLMNFSGRVRYLVTQSVSISCWMLASLLLVIDIALVKVQFFSGPIVVDGILTTYIPSEGFWCAVLTAGLYSICTTILVTNILGYMLGKYPPTFNLGPKQRSLMIFTICLAIWLLCGAVLFAHMIPNITYGSSLYFCTVSLLTIGLGDIVPYSPGAKVLVLSFSLIGVLIMGLIITMIRQVVLAAGGPTVFWHQIERDRLKLLIEMKKKYDDTNGDFEMNPTTAFEEMRTIRKNAKRRQKHASLLLTLLIFTAFWLLGATVFKFTEKWSFFNAFYFCFLCLITIGYGDLTPKSPLGRAFFVCWGIGAIPLMTILISNVGDTLYDIANRLSYFLAKWFFPDYYRYLVERRRKLKKERENLTKEQADDKKRRTKIQTGSFLNLKKFLSRSGENSTKNCEENDSKIVSPRSTESVDEDPEDEREAILNEMSNNINLDDLEEALEREGGGVAGSKLTLLKRLAVVMGTDTDHEEKVSHEKEVEESNEEEEGDNEQWHERDIGVKTVSKEDLLLGSQSHRTSPIDIRSHKGEGRSSLPLQEDAISLLSLSNAPLKLSDPKEGNEGMSETFFKQIMHQLDIIKKDADRMQSFVQVLKPLISDSIDDPLKRYDHDEWESLLGILHENESESLNPMNSDFYWLSENSPLRLPLNEPNFLTMKFVVRMERDIKDSLSNDIRDLERIMRESRSLKLPS